MRQHTNSEQEHFDALMLAIAGGTQDIDVPDFERRMGLQWTEWDWTAVWDECQRRGITAGALETVIRDGLRGTPLPDPDKEPLLGWPICDGEEAGILWFSRGPSFRRATEADPDHECEIIRDGEFRETWVVRLEG